METFRSWLAQQRILGNRSFRVSSVETYTAMFSDWKKHLEAQHMRVTEAAAEDGTAFFELRTLEPISRRRYLLLLDRVYRHLKTCGLEGVNPLQVELSKERELERGLPPSLTDVQLDALEAYLQQISGWKGARDRGLAALLLGAGLRANEVIQLTLQDVAPDYAVTILPTGVHRPHVSLIVPDGPWRAWYDAWLVERPKKGTFGRLVIPTSPKGTGFDPSGLFRRVRSWLTDAEIKAEQSGPNLLRSTFARHVLTSERYTLQQVQEFLGHQDTRATQRHKVQDPSADLLAE